jgi:hypothetical protein
MGLGNQPRSLLPPLREQDADAGAAHGRLQRFLLQQADDTLCQLRTFVDSPLDLQALDSALSSLREMSMNSSIVPLSVTGTSPIVAPPAVAGECGAGAIATGILEKTDESSAQTPDAAAGDACDADAGDADAGDAHVVSELDSAAAGDVDSVNAFGPNRKRRIRRGSQLTNNAWRAGGSQYAGGTELHGDSSLRGMQGMPMARCMAMVRGTRDAAESAAMDAVDPTHRTSHLLLNNSKKQRRGSHLFQARRVVPGSVSPQGGSQGASTTSASARASRAAANNNNTGNTDNTDNIPPPPALLSAKRTTASRRSSWQRPVPVARQEAGGPARTAPTPAGRRGSPSPSRSAHLPHPSGVDGPLDLRCDAAALRRHGSTRDIEHLASGGSGGSGGAGAGDGAGVGAGEESSSELSSYTGVELMKPQQLVRACQELEYKSAKAAGGRLYNGVYLLSGVARLLRLDTLPPDAPVLHYWCGRA